MQPDPADLVEDSGRKITATGAADACVTASQDGQPAVRDNESMGEVRHQRIL